MGWSHTLANKILSDDELVKMIEYGNKIKVIANLNLRFTFAKILIK